MFILLLLPKYWLSIVTHGPRFHRPCKIWQNKHVSVTSVVELDRAQLMLAISVSYNLKYTFLEARVMLKFGHSKKHTKHEKKNPCLKLKLLSNVKFKWKIFCVLLRMVKLYSLWCVRVHHFTVRRVTSGFEKMWLIQDFKVCQKNWNCKTAVAYLARVLRVL